MVEMLKFFLSALLLCSPPTIFVHAQDQSGFISIDCGMIPEGSNYTDNVTGIEYSSDAGFTNSGTSKSISPNFKTSIQQQYWTVRSFPQGPRNCYTLRPAPGKGNKYLIRAWFMFGNYDYINQFPLQFDLHIGVDLWDTVQVQEQDVSTPIVKELIHIPASDYIYVCLVNTGGGTPFISVLELRPLDNNIYTTQSGSLGFYKRRDLGLTNRREVRYNDDMYDRIWTPYTHESYNPLSTTSTIFDSEGINFQLPSIIMSTAVTPKNTSDSLYYWWPLNNPTDQVYLYIHFAEIEILQPNQYREFNVFLNGKFLTGPIAPHYLKKLTISTSSPGRYLNLTLTKTGRSTHPPIINAIEVYTVKQLSGSLTDEKDVAAINNTKSVYGVARNWQGDPCAPREYVWEGLNCSYDGFDSPRIISLNLSSSGLTGNVVSHFIFDLTMIQSLDLSNNNLIGEVPDLSRLIYLRVLNLRGNNFTGSVPPELLSRSNNGSLSLSIDVIGENTSPTSPSQISPFEKQKKKKKKFIIPVVASVIAILFVLLIALIIHIMINRRRKQPVLGKMEKNKDGVSLELKKNRQFTYCEVLAITNNFHGVVGKGGFGTVYHGYIGDIQVAVKMLSQSSIQGYKEFQAEAKILMSVHHKNLTSLVGYCNEGSSMGIIYEYMALGDLARHLSGKNTYVLSWSERLQIAMDAAQGLEYLHHGCKPPIIHRDVKPTNILLNENFRAKLADFGMSRVFPTEDGSHVSTVVVGTPGYLDPEYYSSNRLTEKSDVYSYGIVLLEIITGRPPITKDRNKTSMTEWVNSMLAKGDVKNMVDPRLDGDFNVNSAWKAVELAMLCASRTATRRPTMTSVVTELRECLETDIARPDRESECSIGMMPVNVESDMNPSAR